MNFSYEKITSILLKGFGSQKMEDIGFFPFLLLLMLSLVAAMIVSFLVRFYYLGTVFLLLGLPVNLVS